MAVGIKGYWKLPLGYVLVNGMTAQKQGAILTKYIEALHGVGTDVVSVTFDGLRTNVSMAEQLGANLNPHSRESLRTHFAHPVTKQPIYIFFDACHIMKLIRTAVAAAPLNGLKSAQGTSISIPIIII